MSGCQGRIFKLETLASRPPASLTPCRPTSAPWAGNCASSLSSVTVRSN